MKLNDTVMRLFFGDEVTPDAALMEMMERAEEVYFSKDDQVTRQGDDADHFYLITEGTARVYKTVANARGFVTVLKPGALIGLNPKLFLRNSLDTFKRTADVICASTLKALRISRPLLQEYAEKHDTIKEFFVQKEKQLIVSNFLSYLSSSELPNRQILNELCDQSSITSVKAGHELFRQGDKANGCYFILDGSIDISITDQNATARSLTTLQEGSILGELGVVRDSKRNATARTKTDCDLLFMPESTFLQVNKDIPSAIKRIKRLSSFRIRPKLIDGIIRHPRVAYDSQKKIILEHPSTHALLEISACDEAILQLLDGDRCLRDIVKALPQQQYHHRDLDYYTTLITRLVEDDFAHCPKLRAELMQKCETQSWKNKLQRILTKEYEFDHLDKKLDRFYQLFGRYCCAWYGQLLMATVSIVGVILFFPLYYQAIPHTNLSMFLSVLPLEFVLGWVSLLGHELAHAVATHHSGAKCYKGGFAWYWVGPVGYMDTSLMWTKPLKDRIKVNLAGIYFNLFFAGLWVVPAYLGWFNAYFTVLAWFFAFGSLLGVLGNLSSLLEYDGYYILMDLCNLPNLRGRACLWLLKTLPKKLRSGKNPFSGHQREVYYWLYTLFHLTASILVVQLIVIDIVWPIWGIDPHSNWIWDVVRAVLVVSVLWLAASAAIQEVKDGKMSG